MAEQPTAARETPICCAEDLSIESHPFKAGDVIGVEQAGGVLVPTAEGVEVGHMIARLNIGSLVRSTNPKVSANSSEKKPSGRGPFKGRGKAK